MKIFRVVPAPFHIRKFRNFHGLRDKSFAEQMALYRRENIVLPGGWAAAMQAEGFEVFEAIYNDHGSQSRWAVENGLGHLIQEPGYPLQILKEQIRSFDPDVLYIYAGAFFMLPSPVLQSLRKCCSKKIIITGLWGDELPHDTSYREHFRGVDFVFCSSSVYEKKFTDVGIPAMTIGNCFDDTIPHTVAAQKTHPLIFTGTTGYGFPDHVGRYEKTIELMRRTNLRIWTNEPSLWPQRIRKIPRAVYTRLIRMLAMFPRIFIFALRKFSPLPRIKKMCHLALLTKESEIDIGTLLAPARQAHAQINYFNWKKSLRSLFPHRVSKLLLNSSDYYSLTANAQLVINLHRDEDADIGNIRCYEVTGLGSCLLTDRGQELSEFFEPGADFVPFETVDECVEKINYLLKHPEEIERIARRGQQTTLSRHTVRHRCQIIAAKVRELAVNPATAVRRRRVVQAVYDFNHHPISYDISFFLQAAEVYRKLANADSLHVNIVWPKDIENMRGVSKEANDSVDADARAFRIHHICGQLVQLMQLDGFTHIYQPTEVIPPPPVPNAEILPFPVQQDHHTAYYRLIMANPDLVTGFSASADAHRYIDAWLKPISQSRKVVCVTLRQYTFHPERNSNIDAWAEFLDKLDPKEYAVVIVPDTDHINEFKDSKLGIYPSFEPACFDVDLRFALYEQAFLNMFVNNGPCFAATLNKNINYLLFKIVTPSVPHCTEEFLRWSGFEPGATPKYATPYQKLVWEEDDANVLWREFCGMRDKLLANPAAMAA